MNRNLSHLGFCLFFSTKDQIVMVNGVSMENAHSNYTIQILKTCGKTANVVSTDEPPGLPRELLLPSEHSLLHSSDCETTSQDPDPSDHQAHPSRLPIQPAGQGPAQTNAALLRRQRQPRRRPLPLPRSQQHSGPQRTRKHAAIDVVGVQEAAQSGGLPSTHQNHAEEKADQRWWELGRERSDGGGGREGGGGEKDF